MPPPPPTPSGSGPPPPPPAPKPPKTGFLAGLFGSKTPKAPKPPKLNIQAKKKVGKWRNADMVCKYEHGVQRIHGLKYVVFVS